MSHCDHNRRIQNVRNVDDVERHQLRVDEAAIAIAMVTSDAMTTHSHTTSSLAPFHYLYIYILVKALEHPQVSLNKSLVNS